MFVLWLRWNIVVLSDISRVLLCPNLCHDPVDRRVRLKSLRPPPPKEIRPSLRLRGSPTIKQGWLFGRKLTVELI